MENPIQILLVDDDKDIRDLLANLLKQHGYAVDLAHDGKQMLDILEQKSAFNLIILDVMLPGEDDGFALCRKIRAYSKVPIIMLTAASDDTDRIVGLELGADDYLTKPFNPRELLARIKAILRRSSHATLEDETQSTHSIYKFAGWSLDKTARHLFSQENIEISLSSGEYDLLLALIENPQQVLSRDQLLDITRNRMAGPFDRSIDVQISRLRQKIEIDPKKPTLIKTVRGGGYVFTAVVEHVSKK